MVSDGRIVIVGGGHAAAQLCAGLAEAGLGARVDLVCDEPRPPYHRPPLSKAFLKTAAETPLPLREPAWYAGTGIALHLGDAALHVDRAARTVALASGRALPYAKLVLATGTRARRLHGLPEGLANVCALRDAADAERLRGLLHAAASVTVVGGGFIGLEVAATARALGKTVTVIESAPRLLARSVSAPLAAHVLAVHRDSGIDVRLGVAVGGFEIDGARLAALHVDGAALAVELLVLGIGAAPALTLAHDAGLDCDNGVVVDAAMRTSDPDVLAVGDCTSFASAREGRRIRLESVQNANDQARVAVATLLGRDAAYTALPTFWSEQGALRLQMAGLLPHGDAPVVSHRRPGGNGFSLLHYVHDVGDGRLVCVESVNAPADHIAARKLLDAGVSPAPAVAVDPAVPLKSHA